MANAIARSSLWTPQIEIDHGGDKLVVRADHPATCDASFSDGVLEVSFSAPARPEQK